MENSYHKENILYHPALLYKRNIKILWQMKKRPKQLYFAPSVQCLSPLFPLHINIQNRPYEIQCTSELMLNTASSGVNYLTDSTLPASFLVSFLRLTPPVLPPPPQQCLFIETEMEVVIVSVCGQPRVVIEPICCLAPVGLNSGLLALRWFKRFRRVPFNPFCFCFFWQQPDITLNLQHPPHPKNTFLWEMNGGMKFPFCWWSLK